MTDQEQIDALKAQVNCLRDAYDATPEQCLAEVKAKAIEEYKKEQAETMRLDLATKIMMISQGASEMIDLKALAEQIATQDNRITADPIFVVFQKREIVTHEDYDHDFIAWFGEEGERADEETTKQLDAMRKDIGGDYFMEDEIELIDDEDGRTEWRLIAVKEFDEFVTACFTEKGCNDYLARNKHNLRNPFIYVDSLYRNAEMIGLRDYILSHREQVK